MFRVKLKGFFVLGNLLTSRSMKKHLQEVLDNKRRKMKKGMVKLIMGKKLNLQWVSDRIGEDFKTWQLGENIAIQAQTGTGKTWFIKNKLVNYLGSQERLLLVCNRINLKRQLKMDLLMMYHMAIPYVKDKKGKDTDRIDLKALDAIYQIENVTIKSYQSIQQMCLNYEYDGTEIDLNYDYIVMDEIHYVLIDGSFNNLCRLAYKYLIEKPMPFTIKIFISATMEEIEKPILNALNGENTTLRKYETGIDYSYINVKYFKNDLDIIINSIKNDKTDEKWLVFVSKKVDGELIQKSLGDEISSFIKSRTKSKELESIVTKSSFNKKVLIATKVLDNGINIEDDKLTNIVVMA